MKPYAFIAILGLAALAGACGDDSPSAPTTTTPTTTEFTSRLQPAGSAARSFTTSAAGTITVTLNEAGPAGTRVGVGLGVPGTGIATCALNSSLGSAAGSSTLISKSVDQGSYCVAVFDTGTLTTAIDFKVTIVFP